MCDYQELVKDREGAHVKVQLKGDECPKAEAGSAPGSKGWEDAGYGTGALLEKRRVAEVRRLKYSLRKFPNCPLCGEPLSITWPNAYATWTHPESQSVEPVELNDVEFEFDECGMIVLYEDSYEGTRYGVWVEEDTICVEENSKTINGYMEPSRSRVFTYDEAVDLLSLNEEDFIEAVASEDGVVLDDACAEELTEVIKHYCTGVRSD